jgi:hypothetical protein
VVRQVVEVDAHADHRGVMDHGLKTQRIDNVRSDEPGAAGDQYAHGTMPTSRPPVRPVAFVVRNNP